MEPIKRIRVLGGKQTRPFWDRFNRLQANADLLLAGARPPKGVFRFKSWAEFDEWKMNCRIQGASPKKLIS